MRPFHSLATLAATLLAFLLLPAATAYEAVRVANPALGAMSNRPVAIGSTWTASFQSTNPLGRIAIMDTASRQVIQTISIPAANVPIPERPGWFRTTTDFGMQMATDGTYLATFSASTLAQTPNAPSSQTTTACVIHVWKMPGAQYIGAVDVDQSPYSFNLFLGIGNGRLVHTRSLTSTILQWDVATLAPLPTITIPPALPAIDNDYVGSGSIAMSGDNLVLTGRDDSYRRHLFHLKLSTGVFTDLPPPAGFGNRLFRNLTVGGSQLIATAAPSSDGTASSFFHYDLATAQLVAESAFPAETTTYPFLAPDGSSWAAITVPDGATSPAPTEAEQPSELRTGSGPAVAGSAVFHLPPSSTVTGNYYTRAVPFAFAQGYLWYRGGVDADGTVAYRIPATTQPAAFLTARCLPGQESDGNLKFLLTLSAPVDHPVTLGVRTLADIGSATPGSDYQPIDTTVTFAANQTQAQAEIPLIPDNVLEENETLVLEISSHPPEILASETQFPGIIGGSSFHRLRPVDSYKNTYWINGTLAGRAEPYDLALAGDHVVQTDDDSSFSLSSTRSIHIRPLVDGFWADPLNFFPTDGGDGDIFTSETGRVVITTTTVTHAFDPANTVPLIITAGTPETSGSRRLFIGDTHFILNKAVTPIWETALDPAYNSRQPVADVTLTGVGAAAYGKDYLIGSFTTLPNGGLHLISRSTRADLGQFIPGWRDRPAHIAASGNIFAGADFTRAWFRPIDQPGRLLPLRPAYGPFANITGIRVSGTRIFVTDAPSGQYPLTPPPSIRVFDGISGLETGILLADRNDAFAGTDFSAYYPERSDWDVPPLSPAHHEIKNLTFGGKNILAAIRWPGISTSGLVGAVFTQEANLPGIVDPAPIREDSGSMTFALTEAAPFPLTITTRTVQAQQNGAADWSGSGNTIVIPAGTTGFSTDFGPVNDRLPEGTVPSPIEIVLSGNGITRTLRTTVQVLDDDQLPLSALTHTIEPLRTNFTPVAGGWAYRPITVAGDPQLISWTGDPPFTHGTSFGAAGDLGFASAIAGTGYWLAITQDAFAINSKKTNPSQIQIYQPATKGKTPVRILKGMTSANNFGKTLYARDRTLWVGAPGSSVISPKRKVTPGQVHQYDLPTGKRTRTYKGPKSHAVGFGSSIAANDDLLWIGSSASGGAVFEYSRTKGKLLRSLTQPDEANQGVNQIFGHHIAANSRAVVMDSNHTGPLTLCVYSTSAPYSLWYLSPPAGRHFSSFTLIGDDILVTGGDSLIFYYLAPGGEPQLLTEVLIPGDEDLDILKLEAANGQLALLRHQGGTPLPDNILITLSDIGKLASYLPNLPASLTDASERSTITTPTLPVPPVLTVTQATPGHWQLQLPSPAEAAASNTTVQVSTDLNEWHPLATPTPDGTAWQLLPGTPLESAALTNGTTLQVPPNLPQLFFRLHTP